MADQPAKRPGAPNLPRHTAGQDAGNLRDHKGLLDHIFDFFQKGPGPSPKDSEIVNKGGPGGQMREKTIMDAVDQAMVGAKDDEV